jgi:hypothetical protein
MSRKPTIVLVLVALALAVVVFIVGRGGPTSVDAEVRLVDREPADIGTITIARPDGRTFEAKRSTVAGLPAWTQSAPVTYPLRRTDLDGIAVAVCDLRPLESFRGADSSEYGLEPPQLTVTLDTGEVLELGRRTVAGRAAIRRQGDDAVHIVGDHLHNRLLDTDPVAWRVRRVFDNLSVDVSRISVEQSGTVTRLARLQGQWRIIEPIGCHADPAYVASMLTSLIEGRIESFIVDATDDPSQFGLVSPVITITAETDRRKVAPSGEVALLTDVQTLHIGSAADVDGRLRYARRDGRSVVTTVPAAMIRVLAVPIDRLINPVATVVPVTDIAALECVVGEETISLTRTLDGWAIDEAHAELQTRAAELAAATLSFLIDVRASAVDALPEELEPEAAVLTIRGHGGDVVGAYAVRLHADGSSSLVDQQTGVLRSYDRPFPLVQPRR